MNSSQSEFNEIIEKFLDEFISFIYRGHDHIVARNYYRELFRKLIPEYFCICRDKKIEGYQQ
jgi:hypothetical protein